MADAPKPSAEALLRASLVLKAQAALTPADSPDLRACVDAEAKRCLAVRTQCLSDDGWKVASDKANSSLRTLYRHEDASVHSIKYVADFECSVAGLVSIAREFDLVAGWNKHVKASAVLATPGVFSLVAYGSVFLPWPVTDRDLVLDAVGYDLLDEKGCYVIPLRSASEEDSAAHGYEAAVEALPPTKRKNVRATMREGSGLMLEPLPPVDAGGPTRTRASLVVHMEPKMYMPGWLVKWFLGTVSPYIHRQIVKMLAERFEPGSEYNTRMEANPDLYGFIGRRVSAFLATMPEVDTSTSAEEWHRQRDQLQEELRREQSAGQQEKFRHVVEDAVAAAAAGAPELPEAVAENNTAAPGEGAAEGAAGGAAEPQ